MIDRVNQKPFLLWQAEAVARIRPGDPATPLPEEAAVPSESQIRQAQTFLAAAVLEERLRPLSDSDPWKPDRRSKDVPPVEFEAYVPRSIPLSLVQSALDRYLTQHRRNELTDLRVDPKRRSALKSAVADFSLDIADDEIPPLHSSDRRLGRAFEKTDIRWISSVFAMGWGKLHDRPPYPPDPAPPADLDPRASVLVVGDWASGLDRAKKVAAEMRIWIDKALAKGRQCHVIHLGDTYYGGWEDEYRERFLPNWPVDLKEREAIGSWSLPGNHDMFTGGDGYYGVLLDDERFKPYHQGSSRFSLENEHWQLLGLDSSTEDHALTDDQVSWVDRKSKEANPGRRTMLLSHHQPFSAYGNSGGKLVQQLAAPLSENRIHAWLWGHEHRCALYNPLPNLPFSCCLGHGGIPVWAPKKKPPQVKWHLDRALRKFLAPWAFFGFAVLDFDGAEIDVSFVSEDGQVDHRETIR